MKLSGGSQIVLAMAGSKTGLRRMAREWTFSPCWARSARALLWRLRRYDITRLCKAVRRKIGWR